MYRIFAASFVPALLAGIPAHAQEHDHGQAAVEQQHGSAPADSLQAYRIALMQGDADAMTALFAQDSLVVENGKVEGTFADYMEHHLGPELDAIKSFEFFDVSTQIKMLGAHTALGRETYRYRIELTDGRVFDRNGVATSVLSHTSSGDWTILRYHSSSRAL